MCACAHFLRAQVKVAPPCHYSFIVAIRRHGRCSTRTGHTLHLSHSQTWQLSTKEPLRGTSSIICIFAPFHQAPFSVAPPHHHSSCVATRRPWPMILQGVMPMTPYPLSSTAVVHQRITQRYVIHHLHIYAFLPSIIQCNNTSTL